MRPGSRMPLAGTLNRGPMSRFDELFMKVCRICAYSGMGDFRQLGQARVVKQVCSGPTAPPALEPEFGPQGGPLKIYSLKRNAIPKLAVLATGLTAAILVATINPVPAQAFPNKQQDCTGCHGPGTVGGTTTATPSTLTPAAGAAYTVAITISANASAGDTGYWIANSDAAGVTGTTTGVYGGYSGSGALSYAAPMTAPAASGTYFYKVWAVNGPTDASASTNFAIYSITVGAVVTTPPVTTTTTVPPTTTEPPVTTTATTTALLATAASGPRRRSSPVTISSSTAPMAT